MASPGGAYSGGSSSVQNSASGSEGDQCQQYQHITDQRKRKRMLSNRESARRSRMRKQQHLDSLISEAEQLNKDNGQINSSIGMTTQLYLTVESENAILRAQMAELSNRLQSLNEIINYMNSSSSSSRRRSSSSSSNSYMFDEEAQFNDCGFLDPWNSFSFNNQPIMMASADMLMY